MYDTTERNELSRRRSALVLAIGLHLGLAALLFLFATEKNGPVPSAGNQINIEKPRPTAQPKVVKLP